MDEGNTQYFSKRSGPRNHLEFPTMKFQGVVDRLQEIQPGLHPHFLSLWPDSLCHEGLQSIVDELQSVRDGDRLQEISYQLVAYLHLAAQHGIRTFGHEDLSVSILFGPEDPTRKQENPEVKEEGQWAPETESGTTDKIQSPELKMKNTKGDQKKGALDGMDEEKSASLVRGIDRLTRLLGLPWHTGFVVAGCMLSLRHEMSLMDALHVESTLVMAKDEQGRTNAFSMMASIKA